MKHPSSKFEQAADSIVQELLLSDASGRAQIKENLWSLIWLTDKLLEESGDAEAAQRVRAMHPPA